ncbi:PREDICTED: protein lifeguard 3-like [Dinoponera quadriceps]|uniref:Protein lifeguard 3-like n=1 Tax=Dinoponera quadriceps TaxID=609295 RepID=A0A6P3WZR1_DINQU|nr:PREDICTED: protein lifeguard 3-like [Dinoponera quadriceps]
MHDTYSLLLLLISRVVVLRQIDVIVIYSDAFRYCYVRTTKSEGRKKDLINVCFHSAYLMQPDRAEELQQISQYIPGPPQLPALVKGQKLRSGPYTITVTNEMVAQRERENLELYRAWMEEQRRRNVLPEEDADDYLGDFKQAMIRRSFVRKVFCIVTLQLLFTTCIVAIFMFITEAQKFMILHWYLWIAAFFLFVITYCAVSWSVKVRRTSPYNYICLSLLTIGMSYLAAFASVLYSIEVILLALGMTAVVTIIIVFVATFSKFDLTMRAGLLMIIGLVSIVAIFAMIFIMMFTYIPALRLLISVIATLMLSLYLYFDIQVIMGGRRVELSPDEVVFAATQVYVDIVLLYKYLLIFMSYFHGQ